MLVVDSDAEYGQALATLLRRDGVRVRLARTREQALQAARRVRFDLAVVDLFHGDGTPDYHPTLEPAPACTRVAPLRMTDLDPADAADLACMGSSVSRTSGIDSADASIEAGKSLCASSEWLIRARASQARTGVQVALVQGVGLRILETDSENFCN